MSNARLLIVAVCFLVGFMLPLLTINADGRIPIASVLMSLVAIGIGFIWAAWND